MLLLATELLVGDSLRLLWLVTNRLKVVNGVIASWLRRLRSTHKLAVCSWASFNLIVSTWMLLVAVFLEVLVGTAIFDELGRAR